MKRICCVVLLSAALAALVFAQDRSGPRDATRRYHWETRRERPVPQALSGSLEVVNGRIALRAGNAVYYITGIQGLIGFVDGLKEGARVDLEGYATPAGISRIPGNSGASGESSEAERTAYHMYRVTKLTVDQKTYEIPFEPAFAGTRGPGPSASPPRGMTPGRDPWRRPMTHRPMMGGPCRHYGESGI